MAIKQKAYAAGDIKSTPGADTPVFTVTIVNPDYHEVLVISSRQKDMVRLAAGATVAALNKALGV